MLNSFKPMLVNVVFPIDTLEFLLSKYDIIFEKIIQVILEFLGKRLIYTRINAIKAYISTKEFNVETKIIDKFNTR